MRRFDVELLHEPFRRAFVDVQTGLANIVAVGAVQHPDDLAAINDVLRGVSYLMQPVERVEVRSTKDAYQQSAEREGGAR